VLVDFSVGAVYLRVPSTFPHQIMALSAEEIWTRLLDRARNDLPPQTFKTWLEPTSALLLEGDTITIGAPDRFTAEWNESKHAQLLASYAPVALGHPITIIFKVDEERRGRPQMDLFVAPLPEAKEQGSRGARLPKLQLSARYTFENFVIGKSNELAAAAAQAAAASPGKVYNPLFLYGQTGLGKTHLMQAIAHEILEKSPEIRLCFVATEQFTNELVTAIQTRTTAAFRRRYREVDLLLVDDVHFLKRTEATQEEFFHTFNALYEAGRQIVLTSDRPPNDIPGLENRLVSRFQWGMVADIEPPDLEHRIAILQNKAHLDHLELTIPDEVIQFIAHHVWSSVRELEGSIIRLLAYASLKHQPVSIGLAREALRDKLKPDVDEPTNIIARLTVATIQAATAQEWGVTIEGLSSKSRTRHLTIPRQTAMYLIRELLGLQLVEIGIAFGGRDHSTVIHSLEKVHELQQNLDYKHRLHTLRENLRQLPR